MKTLFVCGVVIVLFLFIGTTFFSRTIKFFAVCNFKLFHLYPYNAQCDACINHLLSKYDEGLLSANIDSGFINFSDGSRLWLGDDFCSYGTLYLYAGKKTQYEAYKPSVKTFLRILALEKKLSAEKYSTDPEFL